MQNETKWEEPKQDEEMAASEKLFIWCIIWCYA